MSELTDEQMTELMGVMEFSGGDALRSAYALGREAGLWEAIAVCDKENVGLTGWRAELCAKAIRDLIAAPDTNSSGGGNATAAADRGVCTTPSEASVSDAGNREAAASPDRRAGKRGAGREFVRQIERAREYETLRRP